MGFADAGRSDLDELGAGAHLVDGRATHVAHGATRNMAPCLVMGEAAGTAAAMASASGIGVADIDIKKLQKQLLAQNVFLGDSYQ